MSDCRSGVTALSIRAGLRRVYSIAVAQRKKDFTRVKQRGLCGQSTRPRASPRVQHGRGDITDAHDTHAVRPSLNGACRGAVSFHRTIPRASSCR